METIIVGSLSAIVSLIGILVASKDTRNKLTNKLDTNQQIMNNEIGHIKEQMLEMKEDIKTNNDYAKLFNENITVLNNRVLTVSSNRDTSKKE